MKLIYIPTTNEILNNTKNIFLILFIVLSVFLFSSVSLIAKFVLVILIFLIFLLDKFKSIFLRKEKKIYSFDYKIFFLLSFFLVYLFSNVNCVSKVVYESNLDLANYIIYFLTFFLPTFFSQKQIEKNISISFIIVITFFLLLIIFKGVHKVSYDFFYNPNILGGYFAINFFYFLENPYIIKKVRLLFCLLLFFLIFFLKNFTSLFVISFYLANLVKKKFKLSGILIYILGFVFLLSGLVLLKYSTLDRVSWFITAVKIFLRHILFGVGLSQFKFFYQEFSVYSLFFKGGSFASIFIHNYFLSILVELGVFGFLLLIVFLFFALKEKIFQKNFKMFYISILCIFIINIYDYSLLIPQNSILLFLFLGILAKKEYNLKDYMKLFYINYFLFSFILLFGIIFIFKYAEIELLLNTKRESDIFKVIKLDKKCWKAYKNLAEIYFNENDLSMAYEYLKKTAEYNPRDSDTFIMLSYLEKYYNKNLKLSYMYFSKAVKLNPKAVLRYKNILDNKNFIYR